MTAKAHKHFNVMKGPLGLFSKEPMTGFYRNGYCQVGPEDSGNHSVAGESFLRLVPSLFDRMQATLTDDFLDFSASRGNDLRSIGLTAGCKWCLCAGRWREALEHASKSGSSASETLVPKVHLHATHEKALDVVDIKDLKKHAAEPPVYNASTVPQSRNGGMGGAIKETTGLAGKGDMTSRE